jgi:hypothetical protein
MDWEVEKPPKVTKNHQFSELVFCEAFPTTAICVISLLIIFTVKPVALLLSLIRPGALLRFSPYGLPNDH